VWHGWHSGYYVTFMNEFIVMNFEKDWAGMWAKSTKVARWREHPAYDTVTAIIGWTYVHFFLPQCFLAFPLLTYNRYGPAYTGTMFIEYIFFVGWLGWGKLVKSWLLSKSKDVPTVAKDKPSEEKEKKVLKESETDVMESKKDRLRVDRSNGNLVFA
jgi:lysophospholipid acyltransferase 5